MAQTMHDVLMVENTKPYWKLGKLINYALEQGIINEKEAEAFDAELVLLVNGKNRSHITIPRAYIEEYLDNQSKTNDNCLPNKSYKGF